MFNKRHKEALKETEILLALALCSLEKDNMAEVKTYLEEALFKLCAENRQDRQKVQDAVGFVNECLKVRSVEEVLEYDAMSLVRKVGELRIAQPSETKELEGFFYKQEEGE